LRIGESLDSKDYASSMDEVDSVMY
jgi:hypothetical protein